MKTTDVFFKSTNFIGREIENVQDLVKALAAGMDIATDEECGYSTIGEREVTDEDGNTHFEEYDKTEEELFNEMKSDLDDKRTLYAGFFLDSREYSIKEAKATTLQSDFYVGQKVYFMKDNKITEGEIVFLSLVKAKEPNKELYVDYKSHDVAERLYYLIGSNLTCNPKAYWSADNRMEMESAVKAALNENNVLLKIGKNMISRNFGEIFATKEELIKHLMEE